MWWCFSFISIILISPLIIALLLVLIIWFNIFFIIILIKTLCEWSSIIWGRFLEVDYLDLVALYHQSAFFVEHHMGLPHHLQDQDQLAPFESH
jgi:hypothetical protein